MTEMSTTLSAERLRHLLHYDPPTGVFTWLRPTAPSVKPGQIAGCKKSGGYVAIRIDNVLYYAHRLAWLYVHSAWPKQVIDHINRNRSDNRIANLRDVDQRTNALNGNPAAPRANSSGFPGVTRRLYGRFGAAIRINGRRYSLGSYPSAEKAAEAYARAKRQVLQSVEGTL